jgi:hypothetical protein
MNCVTIKSHHADGLVAVETYDTDTNSVGGLTVSAPDLWRWLWQCRPCQVRVRGRIYSLQCPATRTGRPTPSAYGSMERWRAHRPLS